MNLDINYFRAIQGMTDFTNVKDAQIADVKRQFNDSFYDSINIEHEILRNGIAQDFIITFDKDKNCNIKPKPNETLNVGDTLFWNNLYWLVVEKILHDNIYQNHIIKPCNHLFKFQLNSPTIYSYWGIITKTYSEYISKEDTKIPVPVGKTQIILPYNEYTMKIYKDMRFLIEKTYDKDGDEIGIVYNVTGFDSETNSYGDNKLLILNVESGLFDEDKDSLEHMICDYISNSPTPSENQDRSDISCEIIYKSLSLTSGGSSKEFNAVFKDIDGNIVPDIVASWNVICNYDITKIIDNNKIILSIDNDNAIGSIVKLQVTNINMQAEISMQIKGLY
ncbi:hypothetical protein [Anaerovorax sp. IOR16]|uniref:hypothetical protein n=1 Tax=Anaerovorax sp. IOR16 TaxID=2773458 RepID=UPI0019D155EA|nr:hypothetical protein [Anaerovorax sp. IOR16]